MENKRVFSKNKILTKENLLTFSLIIIFGIIVIFLVRPASNNTSETPNPVQKTLCKRTEEYPLPPEFQRAISIINQRMGEMSVASGIEKCLNIKYGDLKAETGAEGVFYFDNTISSPNDLLITVDQSYQHKDDYLAAVLLVHEITHARQFYENSTLSCIDKEVSAFWNEFVLLTKLNQGEKDSITSRMYDPLDYPSSDDSIRSLEETIDLVQDASLSCGGDAECRQKTAAILLKEKLSNSEFYQKQCEA